MAPYVSNYFMHYDLVIKNARIMTMDDEHRILECANVGICGDTIMAISTQELQATHTIDAHLQLLTPGLIDCHTHLVYAGDRSGEFAQRLAGASYADIARQGGGILSTVKATREASVETLMQLTKQRAQVMFAHGTTTVEIKSGYGLDLPSEIKLLNVAIALDKQLPISVIPTFLGAHATPLEFKNNTDGYVDYIISTMLPEIAAQKLAVFFDAFCESIAFSPVQIKRLFKAAVAHGFKIKLHAEQLTDQKGAVLAARYNACSVDHLEHLAADDCAILARHKTVAVLLPGAFYFLKETKHPPIAALREHRIPIAIATDANPGTSPFLTLPLMMNMACILFGLTIEEAWLGVTIHAARALDIDQQLGSIEIGKKADLVLWSTTHENNIIYNSSVNYCETVIKSGRVA